MTEPRIESTTAFKVDWPSLPGKTRYCQTDCSKNRLAYILCNRKSPYFLVKKNKKVNISLRLPAQKCRAI